MISEAKAIELIANIKNIYSTYFGWVNGLVSRTFARGYISTKYGWKLWITNVDKINPRTLSNFPIQAHGSEMLRFAILNLIKNKIEISASIHDGLLIHCPLAKLQQRKPRWLSVWKMHLRPFSTAMCAMLSMRLLNQTLNKNRRNRINLKEYYL